MIPPIVTGSGKCRFWVCRALVLAAFLAVLLPGCDSALTPEDIAGDYFLVEVGGAPPLDISLNDACPGGEHQEHHLEVFVTDGRLMLGTHDFQLTLLHQMLQCTNQVINDIDTLNTIHAGTYEIDRSFTLSLLDSEQGALIGTALVEGSSLTLTYGPGLLYDDMVFRK